MEIIIATEVGRKSAGNNMELFVPCGIRPTYTLV
jgi:hypothetical protein